MLEKFEKYQLPSEAWTNFEFVDLMPGGDLNDCIVLCDGELTGKGQGACDYFAYTTPPVPRCYLGLLECPGLQSDGSNYEDISESLGDTYIKSSKTI